MMTTRFTQELEFGEDWALPLTHGKVTVAELYNRYETNHEASPCDGDAHHRLNVEYARLNHPSNKGWK